MIKGAQKQLIVLRTVNSPYFEEAYFVLRREVESKKHNKSDILTEANRILEENTLASHHTPKKSKRFLLWFLLGLLCGSLCVLLLLGLLL